LYRYTAGYFGYVCTKACQSFVSMRQLNDDVEAVYRAHRAARERGEAYAVGCTSSS
jgi:hypothetical protein